MAALGRLSGGAVFLLVFGLLALLVWQTLPASTATVAPPQATLDYASAWEAGHLDRLTYDPASGPDVSDDEGRPDPDRIAESVRLMTGQVSEVDDDHPVRVRAVGEPTRQRGDSGDLQDGDLLQTLEVTWNLGRDRSWTYPVRVVNRETDGVRRVLWRPGAVHPALTQGLVLRSRRLVASRAHVLDVTRRPVRADFAPALVGQVQPATPELAATFPGRVREGDQVGATGLQHVFDDRLAGSAGAEIYVDRLPDYEPLEPWVRQVFVLPPTPGRPLLLSLDPTWQERARAAVDAAGGSPGAPAGPGSTVSLVALNALTGEVLADANARTGEQDLALQGRYPPGTAFRPVLALALARAGTLTPTTRLDCSPWALSQQRFTSSPAAAGPAVDVASAFAHGCTSGFARLAEPLSEAELDDAATSLGFTRPDATGVTAFNGLLPAAPDPLRRVQNALGTGGTLASPLAMARVAAAVRTGEPHQPRLVLPLEDGPAAPEPDAAEGPGPGPVEQALMQQLMAASVTTDPDLTPLRGSRAGRVSAVAGTAAGYGPPRDPRSSAWVLGYQGSVAFAVHVGGTSAAPARAAVAAQVAADFLG